MNIEHIHMARIVHAKRLIAERAKPLFMGKYVVVDFFRQMSLARVEGLLAIRAVLRTDLCSDTLQICIVDVHGDIFPVSSGDHKMELHILMRCVYVIKPFSARRPKSILHCTVIMGAKVRYQVSENVGSNQISAAKTHLRCRKILTPKYFGVTFSAQGPSSKGIHQSDFALWDQVHCCLQHVSSKLC